MDALTEKYRVFFRSNPTIASQLPIGFPGKKLSWHGMTVSCGTCDRELPESYTRGTVTSLIPSVITVECISICKDCLKLIHGIYRFRSDGTLEYTDRAGRWVKTRGRRIRWYSPLIERLKPLWENLI